ncbi:DUF4240 domain-containing protein [Streptomyces sp. NPDC056361]|uniref:DUF4240 domain-containing protein n=1 Tax=Streptomyces sp. NPDC056361 TaxID=3345795 RepID=UPI0035E00728
MTEEDFWFLVDALGGVANQRTAHELTEALKREGSVRVEEFVEILTEKLLRLQSEPLAETPVKDVNDPSSAALVPLMGDALNNFHLAVVAAGRTRFQRILELPSEATAHTWEFGESDELADAVCTAYESVTGEPWPGLPPGPRVTESNESKTIEEAETPWIRLALHGTSDIPVAYFDAAGDVVQMIQDDPKWNAWWSPAEQRDLDIEIEYASLAERNSFSARGGMVWVSLRRKISHFRGLNSGGLAHLAATDIESALSRTAASLGIPVPPQVPIPAHAKPPTPNRDAARARLDELRKRHRGSS